MLRVSLIGNVGADPEVKYTAKGEQMCTIRVAVNQRKRKPGSEEWIESTRWFRVTVWSGWMVDMVRERVLKGSRVMVIGRLDIDDYTTKDGVKGTSYDVKADEIQVLNPPRESREDADAPSGASAQNGRAPAAAGASSRYEDTGGNGEELEDLPF